MGDPFIGCFREVIPRKKVLTLNIVQKGGRVKPESKSFGVVFCGLLLDNTEEIFLDSFGVVLRQFYGSSLVVLR